MMTHRFARDHLAAYETIAQVNGDDLKVVIEL